MGYGDWNAHPGPVVLTSYDPVRHVVTAEHSLNTDAVGELRVINNQLYIPAIDPIHYQHFEDYAVVHADGHLESRTPAGFLHVYDMFERENGEIWMVGSMRPNEWNNSGGAIFRSLDQGLSWDDVTPRNAPSRFYWGGELGGEVVVSGRKYDDQWSSFGTSGIFQASKTQKVRGSRGDRLCLMSGKLGGFANQDGELLAIDSTGRSANLGRGIDFTTDGRVVYLLSSSGGILVYRDVSNVTLNPATDFEWAAPFRAESIHLLNGVLYVGTRSGELFGVALDGQALPSEEAVFENSLPERAGEAIRVQGNRMVVGVPRAAAVNGEVMNLEAGKVVVYERADENGEWQETQVLELSVAESSRAGSWFGSSLSLQGDDLAILEGGTSQDGERTFGSKIHFYVHDGNQFVKRDVLTAGATHGVRLLGDRLHLGRFGQLGSLNFGDFQNQVTSFPAGNEFYQTYAVVDTDPADGDLLMVGLSGDVSRGGGNGAVSVYDVTVSEEDPVQILNSPVGAPSRFGYSLDYRQGLLAVGAPRADRAALQGGAVVLYRKDAAGLFQRVGTLYPEDASFEGSFGHSVAITDDGLVWVGAPYAVTRGEKRGAVYTFGEVDGEWIQVKRSAPSSRDDRRWEYGENVERDGARVIVASGQADDSRSVLERLDVLRISNDSFDAWVAAQNEPTWPTVPFAKFPGKDFTMLEAFALNSQNGQAPKVLMVNGRPQLRFQVREDRDELGLSYKVQVSSDLGRWVDLSLAETIREPGEIGWEQAALSLGGENGYVRLQLSLE